MEKKLKTINLRETIISKNNNNNNNNNNLRETKRSHRLEIISTLEHRTSNV